MNMPFFDNFFLDGIVLLASIFLVPIIIGFYIFGLQIIYAVIRGLWDKLTQSKKVQQKSNKDE